MAIEYIKKASNESQELKPEKDVRLYVSRVVLAMSFIMSFIAFGISIKLNEEQSHIYRESQEAKKEVESLKADLHIERGRTPLEQFQNDIINQAIRSVKK